MNKKLQDLAWACLPKEVREKMKEQYSMKSTDNWDNGFNACLDHYFGLHNLISDTEPDEMLIISRKVVQDWYKKEAAMNIISDKEMIILRILFGDKCLPDNGVLTAENVTESVIAQPKTLSVGDKVRLKFDSEKRIKEVYRILPDGYVMFGDKGNLYSIEDIEIVESKNKR